MKQACKRIYENKYIILYILLYAIRDNQITYNVI